MKSFTFVVPSLPVAQPRQRHRIVSSKEKSFVQNYTPKNDPVNTYKKDVRIALLSSYSGPVLDCAVGIFITAYFPRPKSLCWETKPMPHLRKKTKPDNDNIEKSTWDALSGLLYRDDSLISDNGLKKRICAGVEQPSVQIRIEVYEESDPL